MSKRLADCQRVIGYCFANPALLEIALTHSSVRTPDRECNERQEFLGDSVLGLAITEELYKRLPDQQEGELTRIKSAVVSRGALYRVSTRLGLPRFVEVAKGVGRREELPVSLTANLVESIIGAIYLDAGFFPAREFILKNLGPEVEDVMNDRVARNYKSLLQHEAQQILGATPIYRTIEEEGPDHRKAFVVAAVVRGTEYGRASGINKKEAEQEAARHALDALTRRGRGRRRRGPEPREGRDGRGPRGARPRGREDVRPNVAQSRDDAAWQAWAEGASGAPPPTPSAAPAAPSAPYVVGPEPEEAYFDAPADALANPADPRAAVRPSSTPAAPRGDAPEGGPPPSEDDAPRGRRRGRRGGRGRRAGPADTPAPSAAGSGIAPEADADFPASFVAPTPAAHVPVGDPAGAAPEPPTWPDGGADESAPARRTREPRPRVRRDREAAPPRRRAPAAEPPTPTAPAEPPHASEPPRAPVRRAAPTTPTLPGFGAGVLADALPPTPPPTPASPPTPIVGVPAVRKAPRRAPAKPEGGGFGEGLA